MIRVALPLPPGDPSNFDVLALKMAIEEISAALYCADLEDAVSAAGLVVEFTVPEAECERVLWVLAEAVRGAAGVCPEMGGATVTGG